MECYELDANLDIQRRFTWKEVMDNGSSENYSPNFTQDMLWTKIRWTPMGKY